MPSSGDAFFTPRPLKASGNLRVHLQTGCLSDPDPRDLSLLRSGAHKGRARQNPLGAWDQSRGEPPHPSASAHGILSDFSAIGVCHHFAVQLQTKSPHGRYVDICKAVLIVWRTLLALVFFTTSSDAYFYFVFHRAVSIALFGSSKYRGMMPGLLGYYHHYEVKGIQETRHGWYEEPVYAGWESTKNFVDTGELTGLVTARAPAEAIKELDNISAEWGGDEDDMSDAEEDVRSPQAGWGSLDGLTTAQRCVETPEVVRFT